MAFKVAASVLAVVLAVAGVATYGVSMAAMRSELPTLSVPAAPAAGDAAATKSGEKPLAATAQDVQAVAAERAAEKSALAVAESINGILARRLSMGAVSVAALAALGVALAVIWLNLTLTYLAVAVIGLTVAWPMMRFGSTTVQAAGTVLAGGLALGASFAALVQLLRTVLMASHPVLAIARNVVDEAVRMKVSLVFIILLICMLAALPTVLDSTAPLRYRVQGFLSYGLTGAYWITLIMAVFLGCATVAFEQRDKIVWQTMTKPVTAWQFVVGKWLGVWAVAALLLGVSACGVFLFTEYLRNQPAQGEVRAFVAEGGQAISSDRLLLETQVLTARRAALPAPPVLKEAEVEKELDRRVQNALASDSSLSDNDATRSRLRMEQRAAFLTEVSQRYLAIPPGTAQTYVFTDLGVVREQNLPMTLRFKVNAGANLPTETYKLTFLIDQMQPFVLESRLGLMQTQTIPPISVLLPNDVPDDPRVVSGNGVLRVQIVNGDVRTGRVNPETISFAGTDFQVSYAVDTFGANFLRAVLILWLRIGLLTAVAVMAGTFLSFPVAVLVSFGVLFMAESVNFMAAAMDSFVPFDIITREVQWYKIPAYWIGTAVVWVMDFYGRIRPSEAVIEGKLVPWFQVTSALFTLGLLTLTILAGATAIFRRRELAIYSGQ